MMALAYQAVAAGRGPVRELVVVKRHGPADTMRDPVMVAAQGDQVGEIGRPTLVPVDHVMVVAPVDRRVAPGESAAAVAHRNGSTLGDRGQSLGMADINGNAHFIHDHRPHFRVASPHVNGGPGKRRSLRIASFVVVHDQGDLGPRGRTRAGFGTRGDPQQLSQRDDFFLSAGKDVGNPRVGHVRQRLGVVKTQSSVKDRIIDLVEMVPEGSADPQTTGERPSGTPRARRNPCGGTHAVQPISRPAGIKFGQSVRLRGLGQADHLGQVQRFEHQVVVTAHTHVDIGDLTNRIEKYPGIEHAFILGRRCDILRLKRPPRRKIPRSLSRTVRQPRLRSTRMIVEPDSSAVRTALWRALHLAIDPPPHLIVDTFGLALASPEHGWEQRGDMHPEGTAPYRLAIVARTRFVEDLLASEHIGQYVLLGAGLDTFAQRHPELADAVEVYEVDQPGPQEWKRQRLIETGLGIPPNEHLVPVDFEADQDWWAHLVDAGFDAAAPALVSSSGVPMYLTHEANASTLQRLAQLGPGSVVAMTFMVPFELLDDADRPGLEGAARGAAASGTPWLSFYTPDEMLSLANEAGFAETTVVGTEEIVRRYAEQGFAVARVSGGEAMLLART